MKKANNEQDGIKCNDIRIYLSQVMKRAYTNPDLSANDVKTLASIAMSLDRFLKTTEKQDKASQMLYSELKNLTSEGMVTFEGFNTGMMNKNTEYIDKGYKLITKSGKYLYLGSIIGSGGEGSVYKIPSMPGKVAKIYKPRINRKEKERHIEAFLHNKVPAKINNMLIATIPEECIYAEDGEFVGYIMSQVFSQFKIYDVMRETPDRAKFFPELDYRGLIIIAYNLAEIVNTLHRHNVIVGDMNLGNIVVNQDGTVCLIDADSFDIIDSVSGERFPCSVGIQELLAPELQTGGNVKGLFTKETDYFSLAIIIFRLLMNNMDPFGSISYDLETSALVIPGNNPIKNGECLYVKEIEGKDIPLWAPQFDTLPLAIRELFVRVFDYDRDNYLDRIKKRPSAAEWMKALMEFYQTPMRRCNKNGFHWYRRELEECPLCMRRKGITKPVITVGL